MLNSQMLDTAIGLVFIYFFLSLLCSVIIETISGLTKKRPRMLRDGIRMLLNDPNALNKLYEQPLFIGKSVPKNLFKSLGQNLIPSGFKKNAFPSYISSRSFILSLLESLKTHPDVVRKLLQAEKSLSDVTKEIEYLKAKLGTVPESDGNKKLVEKLKNAPAEPAKASSMIEECYREIANQPAILKEILKEIRNLPSIDTLPNIKALVNNLADDNDIKKALVPLLETVTTAASDAVDKALESMEKWYDEAMERVTGWYKRYSQAFTLILAFVVALALNADTFQIGKAIYRDQALRDSLVRMADEEINPTAPATKQGGQGDKPKPAGTAPSAVKEKPGKVKPGATTTSSRTASEKPQTEKDPATAVAATKQGGQGDKSKPAGTTSSTAKEKPGTGEQGTGGQPPSGATDKELEEKAKKVDKIYKQISSVNLPIGWPLVKVDERSCWAKLGFTQLPDMKEHLDLVKLLGIILTALMASLGSNFWFELLNKLLNMRNAGKKPLTREEQDAQKK
jgi:hypothetical protein